MSSLLKTPITILNELCMQEGTILYDDIPKVAGEDGMFSCKVEAFDLMAIGSDRSKKQAKHKACANLIAQLMQQKYFADKISSSTSSTKSSSSSSKSSTSPIRPHAPHQPATVDGNDAVELLRTICVQREYPLPSFNLKEAYGEPHCPIFTGECQLSSIKRTGTASKKTIAKQLAFHAVLEIVQSFPQNEEQQQLATIAAAAQNEESELDSEQPKTYREMIKLGITPTVRHICDRHNFFLRLPEQNRLTASEILSDANGGNKQKIELACDALKLKYNIYNVSNDKHSDCKAFVLLHRHHDCVVVGNTESDLYDNVVNHFKTMLNL